MRALIFIAVVVVAFALAHVTAGSRGAELRARIAETSNATCRGNGSAIAHQMMDLLVASGGAAMQIRYPATMVRCTQYSMMPMPDGTTLLGYVLTTLMAEEILYHCDATLIGYHVEPDNKGLPYWYFNITVAIPFADGAKSNCTVPADFDARVLAAETARTANATAAL